MVLYKAHQQRELETLRMNLVERTIRLGQKCLRGALGRMLMQSIRSWEEKVNNATAQRTLAAVSTAIEWCLDLKTRCALKGTFKIKKIEIYNTMHYTSCNYRENYFYFVHSSFIVFSI